VQQDANARCLYTRWACEGHDTMVCEQEKPAEKKVRLSTGRDKMLASDMERCTVLPE
jgi:hypothetical protein